MKQSLLSTTLAVMLLVIVGCTHTNKKEGISGKWSFKTLDGNYAELWIDNNSLLTVRNPSKRPFVFDYQKKGDTVVLYQYGQRNEPQFEVDRFIIKNQTAETLDIRQDTVDNSLTLISEEAINIKNTDNYKEGVVTEFEQRLK